MTSIALTTRACVALDIPTPRSNQPNPSSVPTPSHRLLRAPARERTLAHVHERRISTNSASCARASGFYTQPFPCTRLGFLHTSRRITPSESPPAAQPHSVTSGHPLLYADLSLFNSLSYIIESRTQQALELLNLRIR